MKQSIMYIFEKFHEVWIIFLTFTTYFRCPGESMELCNIMRELLHIGAYVDLVQNTLVQAQVNIIFFLELNKFLLEGAF